MAIDQLLTTSQASEILNVPVTTLRYWRHAGTGPKSFALSPRRVMYRRSDVLEWLEAKYAEGQRSA